MSAPSCLSKLLSLFLHWSSRAAVSVGPFPSAKDAEGLPSLRQQQNTLKHRVPVEYLHCCSVTHTWEEPSALQRIQRMDISGPRRLLQCSFVSFKLLDQSFKVFLVLLCHNLFWSGDYSFSLILFLPQLLHRGKVDKEEVALLIPRRL